MKNSTFSSPRRLRLGVALAVTALALAACGSDDATVEVPEGGTGNAYTQAIIESESHDEIIFAAGGDMVVAGNCDPAEGGTIVTVVAEGLDPGDYVGVFDPATDVDVTLTVNDAAQSVAATEMTLDADEYTVTFAGIEGGEFSLRGCAS
jgi:hypothetical protein